MRLKPFKHQIKTLEDCKGQEYWAYFLEQGLGKTKVTIDDACRMYKAGYINAVIVLAPNGVHVNWAVKELPEHMWEDIGWNSFTWKGSQMSQKRKKELKYFIDPDDITTMGWFLVNIEAIRQKNMQKIIDQYINTYGNILIVCDESTTIKNIKAQQTKAAIAIADKCRVKRILTGTPIEKDPLDLFSQCRFLNPNALKYRSYTAFRNTFAIDQVQVMGQRRFLKTVGFQNLDKLTENLSEFSTRLRKQECIDLPEKIYQDHVFELSSEQQKAYNELKATALTQFDNGEITSVTSAITLMIRLQQIISGYTLTDEGEVVELKNNRMEQLEALLSGISGKIVIWTKFTYDIENICKHLSSSYGKDSYVSYYGATDADGRARAIQRFQCDDTCRFFVANKTAATGITLTAGNTAIYYSHDYNYGVRAQSEDRIHRIGQEQSCLYIDMVANGTLDFNIKQVLKTKRELSELVIENIDKIL